ncbi:MAG: hypothetical protein QM733_08505 [Ilumatobacteraceae bacterium]
MIALARCVASCWSSSTPGTSTIVPPKSLAPDWYADVASEASEPIAVVSAVDAVDEPTIAAEAASSQPCTSTDCAPSTPLARAFNEISEGSPSVRPHCRVVAGVPGSGRGRNVSLLPTTNHSKPTSLASWVMKLRSLTVCST